MMKGMVIGGLGIFHVFTAQFAIGGGFLMLYYQHLAASGKAPQARFFLDSYFKFLVLISFVLGAVTGVAMWFTSIQLSPRTIGVMIDEFHWLWATEWAFFCLEVVAGYAFYRYAKRLTDRSRFFLLLLYAVGAWMSLFWINGIISYQLTPGAWSIDAEPGASKLWAGFFNPSFFPSLIYRTAASLTIAALVGCVVINTIRELDREARRQLITYASHLMLPMVVMPLVGVWFLAVIPEDSRGYVTGGSVAMTMFMTIAVGASFLIAGYAIVGLWRQRLYINGATATLLAVLAFVATAGGEFVREGVRKPYTVRNTLFSNSVTHGEIEQLRQVGSVTYDPYPLINEDQYPSDQIKLGAKVFRFQCSICHTTDGVNGLSHLTGTWTTRKKRLNIAQLQRLKPFMPPFAGNAEELEALVQFIEWSNQGRPDVWNVPLDREALEQIQLYLDEVGTKPGYLAGPVRTEEDFGTALAGAAAPDAAPRID